jgi:hypothetical protein
MLALPLFVPVLSLALALICSAIPWLARQLRFWSLVIALIVGITVGLLGAVLTVPLSPWTDLVVLVVAWSSGLVLGRGMPAHFRPVLLVFLCLSVLDVLLAVGGYPEAPRTVASSSPLLHADFLFVLPWGRFEINLVDLLLITALAEHWRRRGGGYLIGLLPGALGFLLADGVVLATGLGLLPGFPFFTAGYVVSEGVYRYVSHQRAAPPAVPVR